MVQESKTDLKKQRILFQMNTEFIRCKNGEIEYSEFNSHMKKVFAESAKRNHPEYDASTDCEEDIQQDTEMNGVQSKKARITSKPSELLATYRWGSKVEEIANILKQGITADQIRTTQPYKKANYNDRTILESRITSALGLLKQKNIDSNNNTKEVSGSFVQVFPETHVQVFPETQQSEI